MKNKIFIFVCLVMFAGFYRAQKFWDYGASVLLKNTASSVLVTPAGITDSAGPDLAAAASAEAAAAELRNEERRAANRKAALEKIRAGLKPGKRRKKRVSRLQDPGEAMGGKIGAGQPDKSPAYSGVE